MTTSDILLQLNHSYPLYFRSLELLSEGGSRTFCAWSDHEKYFLKVIPFAFCDSAKQSTDILLYLEENRFPSPSVIKTKSGKAYVEGQDKENILVVFNYLEGEEPEPDDNLELAGELIGKLHQLMRAYKEDLPEHNKKYFINRYIDLLKQMSYDENKLNKFREYGEYLWSRVENLPRGFCHGDLYPGNLFKTLKGNYYILDFDTASYAFPLYDCVLFCNRTNYFDYEEEGLLRSKKAFQSFLKGYSRYSILSTEEINAFNDLLAIYHYQLQATILEIHGPNCVDEEFLDRQLDWLMCWRKQCEKEEKCVTNKQL
ncbi:phosphotransferase [Anaerocolumna sp. AGMB13020]|uniref:phosphotransferase enzyme family protein n=1 Tax=Anaerocolumna sp. AGMB13020 TaxID=3081750 RepID=UPI002955ABDB|nr:phosphotransferase [Anaerocolumna sp. AGMB13020]WOO37044.1 phosphotransferase [Anaerocolumna sp. AGMB13020]